MADPQEGGGPERAIEALESALIDDCRDTPLEGPSPPAEQPPTLAGYEILGELGRGGMGVVYKAYQRGLGRVVALKMILAGRHAGSADRDRFRTEAEAIARLQHPNFVQIHDIGEQDGKPFFSLEFCAGGSLDKKLDGAPWAVTEAARLVETLARAMHVAHGKKIVHRDLKPGNVLLTEDGTPKISDFGLARKLDEAGRTAPEAILGTPSYMAPEQTGGRGQEIGPATDVYALGAILYELLTGRPPFRAAKPLDTILQVAQDEPVPPRQLQSKTPNDLNTICLKCLQKGPIRRYPTALALAEDLEVVPDRAADQGTPRWCNRARLALVSAEACRCRVAGRPDPDTGHRHPDPGRALLAGRGARRLRARARSAGDGGGCRGPAAAGVGRRRGRQCPPARRAGRT